MTLPPPRSTLFPYTTLFRSICVPSRETRWICLNPPSKRRGVVAVLEKIRSSCCVQTTALVQEDRKSTRLNSSHEWISYAVFCLKKKKKTHRKTPDTTQ